ncbi:MAG: ArsR/SmtB family transcription factor [Anaerolineae bacterium]
MTDTYVLPATLFKALAHPMRLRILEVLAEGEACVCHLTCLLGQRQPYISQQLMALREAGLVSDRRDGTIIYYSLSGPQIAGMLDQARDFLARTGVEIERQPAPKGKLAGCSCPHCSEP